MLMEASKHSGCSVPEAGERGSWIERALVVVACAYLAWNALYFAPYTVDDTFISMRYAQNLVDGHGLVYNIGERVEGYSNFSWVLITATVSAIGLPILTTLKVIGLACALGTVVAGWRLGRRLLPRTWEGQIGRSVVLLLLAFNTSFAVWSQAGLETTLFAFFVVSMCLRHEFELEESRPFPWSAVLFGLAWISRPEAPIYSLYFIVRRLQVAGFKAPRRRDIDWLAILAVIVIPFEVWGFYYYGGLFPHTHAAKIGGAGIAWRQPLMWGFAMHQGVGFMALLVASAAGIVSRRGRGLSAAWVPALCGVVFVVYAGQDWMPRYRLLVPAMPFIFVLVGAGSAELLRRTCLFRPMAWAIGILVLVASGDYARVQAFGEYRRGPRRLATEARSWTWFSKVPAQYSQREYPMEDRAWGLLIQVPAGEWICSRDIGFPGFLTGNPIWDFAGLFTPSAAAARHDESAGCVRAMCDDMLERSPAMILVKDSAFQRRIEAVLRTHPTVLAAYERRPETRRGHRVAYIRRDMPEFDVRRRIEDAVAQFPEYAERADEVLTR